MNQEVRFSRLEPEQRKALLIEATLACLKRHGFQGASVRKICAEAGVSVGLINHHYDGRTRWWPRPTWRSPDASCACSAVPSTPRRRRPPAALGVLRGILLRRAARSALLDAWLAFWGAVGSIEAIGRVHDHSYGEYRALLVGVLRQLAEEGGWADFDAELAAISLSALLDGLWLESGLNPATFTPRQGVQICEAWVDGLEAGAHRRFRRAMEAC